MPSIEFAIFKVLQEHKNGLDLLNDTRIQYNTPHIRTAIRQNLEQIRHSKVSEMELQLIMELIEDYRTLHSVDSSRSYSRNRSKSSNHFLSELVSSELFNWGSSEETFHQPLTGKSKAVNNSTAGSSSFTPGNERK